MRVKITYTSYFDINPEDFREINDEGKVGYNPSSKEIFEFLKSPDMLEEYLNSSLDSDFHVEFNEM